MTIKEKDFEKKRRLMVKNQLLKRGIEDKRVLTVMGTIPRHHFVDPERLDSAYNDSPLPIGAGQTISQPYMVALMSECLQLKGKEIVLEIGTGSGYQTAVLAELARFVFTVERFPSLAAKAKNVLEELGYTNFRVIVGDGSKGLPEESLFDGIIVTAGAPAVPQVLLNQLSVGGKLVVPVGNRYSQTLCRITREKGKFTTEQFTLCVFVPLVGSYGWKEEE